MASPPAWLWGPSLWGTRAPSASAEPSWAEPLPGGRAGLRGQRQSRAALCDSQARAGSQEGSAFLRGETSPTSLPGPEAGASLTRAPSTALSLRRLGRGDPVHTSFFLLVPDPPPSPTRRKRETKKRESLHKLNSLTSCFIFKLFGSSQLYMATSALAVERKKTYKPRLWLGRRSELTVLGRGAGARASPGLRGLTGQVGLRLHPGEARRLPGPSAPRWGCLDPSQGTAVHSRVRVEPARVRWLAGAGPGRRLLV